MLDVVSFHVDADNDLDLNLRLRSDGSYPDDATVTVTIRDKNGTAITGATNLPMTHVVGTTGSGTIYRASIPSTVPMPIGLYEAKATATKSGLVESKHAVITVEKG